MYVAAFTDKRNVQTFCDVKSLIFCHLKSYQHVLMYMKLTNRGIKCKEIVVIVLAAWHGGHRLRLQKSISRVRIPARV
jgi:hypothetical protein